MPGVCRNNDTAGGDLIPSQGTVYVNNNLVIIDNNYVAAHGPGEHDGATFDGSGSGPGTYFDDGATSFGPKLPASLNTTVYLYGKLICVEGDTATCGHVATGSPDVSIGG
jgi:uncharacterized Zn-binding protein involved in type VI secretion